MLNVMIIIRFQGEENDENGQDDSETDAKDTSSINPSYVLEQIGKTDIENRGHKNVPGQFQCSKCEKHFSSSASLYNHSKRTHEGIRYPCNKCQTTFKEKGKLKRHIQNIHEGVKFPCDLCDHISTTKWTLNAHKKNKH